MSIKFNEIDNAKALYTQGLAIQKVYWRDNLIWGIETNGSGNWELPVTIGLKHHYDFSDMSTLTLSGDTGFTKVNCKVSDCSYEQYFSDERQTPALTTLNQARGLKGYYFKKNGTYYNKLDVVKDRAIIPSGGVAYIIFKHDGSATSNVNYPLLGSSMYSYNPSTNVLSGSGTTNLYEGNLNHYPLGDGVYIGEFVNCSYREYSTTSLVESTFDFIIGEIIIYDGYLTDAERYQMRDYLSVKWANTEPTEVPQELIDNEKGYIDKYYNFIQDFGDTSHMTLTANNEVSNMKCLNDAKCSNKTMYFGLTNSGQYPIYTDFMNGKKAVYFDNNIDTPIKEAKGFYYLNGYTIYSPNSISIIFVLKLDESLDGYRSAIFGTRAAMTELYFDGVDKTFKSSSSYGTLKKVVQPGIKEGEPLDLSKPMIVAMEFSKNFSYACCGAGINYPTAEQYLPYAPFKGYMCEIIAGYRPFHGRELDNIINNLSKKWFE